ncbi:hypothetical protein KFL_002820070 [Klebsormidium nitens]|uniref:Uncharacterized protein n=1 Tax=Klebsormidium nitens TaxID=105231 RepID=A0A1Y1I8N1_KLENI|nr:hypothetical protein KFL_002820070 [Klebsormidium nitens]|eukprot:GAQ86312.1 hypothetical protein KFL_002820070 [Klebsormidium nitens]
MEGWASQLTQKKGAWAYVMASLRRCESRGGPSTKGTTEPNGRKQGGGNEERTRTREPLLPLMLLMTCPKSCRGRALFCGAEVGRPALERDGRAEVSC